ncbi:MAG TPA: hypothetical protein VIH12_10780 [Solibacillus sp.]
MNVMKKAWEIAKQGQEKFGGKVKEYFAASLKMAWALIKKAATYTIITTAVPAELQGSEKQIKWAKQIRRDVYNHLIGSVTHEVYISESSLPMGKPTVESRPVTAIFKALQSEATATEYFAGLRDFQVADAKASAITLVERWERFKEIVENPSAKFYIDNRYNTDHNYMFTAFKEYVSTGLKKF